MKISSQRYNINSHRPRHGHEYTKYKMCLSIIMVICVKQHLSNIWSSIHEKLSNNKDKLKTSVYLQKIKCLAPQNSVNNLSDKTFFSIRFLLALIFGGRSFSLTHNNFDT